MITLVLVLAAAAALPPITSTSQALVVLRSPNKVEALAAVKDACRGKYRRELRDQASLKTQLEALFAAGPADVKKAVLDTSPCFSKFTSFIAEALKDPDDAIVSYGAEVSARLEDPELVPLLHAAMAPRKSACLKADAAYTCVWLTYAPGALLGAADEATRTAAGEQAAEMLASAHPKVREVATETLTSTRLPKFKALAKKQKP